VEVSIDHGVGGDGEVLEVKTPLSLAPSWYVGGKGKGEEGQEARLTQGA
jgi:hypothetical protein